MLKESKDTVNIISPVVIKSIVTDNLIESLKNRIENSLEALSQKMHQLDYQKQYLKMQKKKGEDINDSNYQQIKKMEDEINLQIKRIKDQEIQVDNWQLGQEVIMTQKESLISYKIGDYFSEDKLTEVIVKDGIIQEIRRD